MTVTAPAEGIEITGDSCGGMYWSAITDPKQPYALNLKKGDVDALYYVLSPSVCIDAGKVKWSVKGSGVMVKNGVVTAKSLSKTDKKGNVNPAVVTLSCGKQTYSIQVYVSE